MINDIVVLILVLILLKNIRYNWTKKTDNINMKTLSFEDFMKKKY